MSPIELFKVLNLYSMKYAEACQMYLRGHRKNWYAFKISYYGGLLKTLQEINSQCNGNL